MRAVYVEGDFPDLFLDSNYSHERISLVRPLLELMMKIEFTFKNVPDKI